MQVNDRLSKCHLLVHLSNETITFCFTAKSALPSLETLVQQSQIQNRSPHEKFTLKEEGGGFLLSMKRIGV